MDYVALLRFRGSVPSAERDKALARRATWQYPAGVTLIAEYWPALSGTTVVSIFSTESFDSIFEFELEWGDVFDIDISPAVSHEDGLRIGADVFGRLHRLRS